MFRRLRSVRILPGEGASTWVEAGRPRNEDLTSRNDGVTVRTDRFVEVQLNMRSWHVLIVSADDQP